MNMKKRRKYIRLCHGTKKNKCCVKKRKDFCEKKSDSFDFFKKYNSIDLIQSFAGLSLLPENHGKYVRMEELSLASLQNFNKKNEYVSSKCLKKFLGREYPLHYLEDPPVNLFTDLITFYGGDYLIFPGITENGSFILTNLLSAVFHWPDSGIPKQFVINCRHSVSFILALSNAIAQRLGYSRYQKGAAEDTHIVVPNEDILNQLKVAVTFSESEIDQICLENSIAKAVINIFLIDLDSQDLSLPHIEESPLLFKPVLKIQDKLIVISPATLSFALTDYIWAEAERRGCMKEVNEAYHNLLWNNLQFQLGQMNFKKINIEIKLHEREGFYQFDDDKIAYVQFINDKGVSYKFKEESKYFVSGKSESLENHKKEAITQLLSKPQFTSFEILDFIILSPIGRDFYYPIAVLENLNTIVIPIFELDILWNLSETKAIDFWKFAIAKQEQLPNFSMMSFSFLDQYKIYKDHQDSFYLSDESNYEMLHVQPGYAEELIRKAKLKTDKHSALKNINDRFANIPVERKDKYGPIYIELMGLLSSKLEFLVEGFYQPVWVTPKPNLEALKGEIRHMYWEFNDAIAYWLWQIQHNIKNDLKLVEKPLTISFDLIPIEKFETIERNFIRDPNFASKFQIEATDSTCTVLIPSEINAYLYGSDNEGERVLVRNLLIAINKLLEKNKQPIISEERISQIIENNVPFGMKKKVFILDTSDNLLLDPRNLQGHRYVQEYDTSIVLNTIVPALGTLCPPVGDITDKKGKNDLAFNIVQKVLFPTLKSKISQYDSTELLKKLITFNESLIRKREELRVHTPTRIACFVSIEQHQIDLREDLGDVNRTTIVLRCLIEHIAAEPSNGTKTISITAIDELVAIMDQIISWGSISDQIHFDLFDIKMSVLPSGRIGTEKAQIKEVFDPYYDSKTQEDVTDIIRTFNQVFPQNENIRGKDVPENLDKAFIVDYGISFSRICEFIEGLIHIGFLQSTPFASFPLIQLKDEVNKYVNNFEEKEFQNAIAYLSLSNRGKVKLLYSKKL